MTTEYSYTLQATSCKQIQRHKGRNTATRYKLQAASYKLQATSCKQIQRHRGRNTAARYTLHAAREIQGIKAGIQLHAASYKLQANTRHKAKSQKLKAKVYLLLAFGLRL